MEFNDWLIKNGYITNISEIVNELSANEVDELYQLWTNETGLY